MALTKKPITRKKSTSGTQQPSAAEAFKKRGAILQTPPLDQGSSRPIFLLISFVPLPPQAPLETQDLAQLAKAREGDRKAAGGAHEDEATNCGGELSASAVVEFFQQAAAVCQAQALHARGLSAGLEILLHQRVTLVLLELFSAEQHEQWEQAVAERLPAAGGAALLHQVHFITTQDLATAHFLAQSRFLGAYIYRKFADPQRSAQFYGRLLKGMLAPRPFGLQHYIPGSRDTCTVSFRLSGEKQAAVEVMREYLLEKRFKNRIALLICNAADELLMNAIFDAPHDSRGHAPLDQTARDTPMIRLTGKSAIELQFGFDGEIFAMAVVDHYGSLEREQLLGHLSRLYVSEPYRLETSTAGAGIGLALAFRMGGGFLFLSKRGVRTEVMLFFRKTETTREFKDQFKFLATRFD